MGIFNKKDKEKKQAAPKAKSDVSVKSKAETTTKSKPEAAKVAHGHSRFAGHILRPVISEKAALLHSVGQYIFSIAPEANKITVKQALKDMYNVDAVHVAIIKNPAKSLRRRHGIGWTKVRRKAVVRLKAGQSINVYEGI